MKKKVPIYLIIIAAVVVVGVAIAGVIIAINENQNQKAKQEVEDQIRTLLAQSDEIAASAPDDNANNIGEFVYSKMTYEVVEATDNSCTIRVSAPSLYKVFFEAYDPNKYEPATDIEGYNAVVEEILGEILSALTNGEYEMVTANVEVPLNSDGEIVMTRELIDAMYGGLLTIQDELAEQYFESING
ncbi:MAG: hypothetical protein IJX37_04495 [Oscillospiraceae bacterium]|nr:hypothetical protein [Oscillospiraceae bacterium]